LIDKATALRNLGKHTEAIKCYDKAKKHELDRNGKFYLVTNLLPNLQVFHIQVDQVVYSTV
jgi:tetratricopeptide (TPR) repeat protein